MEMFNPAHPGKILKTGYIDELHLSVAEVALKLGVSRKTIYDIINGKASITPAMALKIAKAFNSDAQFWLDLQTQYDLWQAKQTTNLDNVQVLYG
ncbi:MAG TPA: addiction module antidote protein, HigA family [Cyanobacteria bacterium UBA11991]|nr:HigA family addiction module antitoxin [Cyanobacteriota bacterium]HCB10991.1 addiction module antidote protein, HigA family [Cyanobacteria bacterium UBA11991]